MAHVPHDQDGYITRFLEAEQRRGAMGFSASIRVPLIQWIIIAAGVGVLGAAFVWIYSIFVAAIMAGRI